MNNRDAAWTLLTEFTQSENLRKHALTVEACMRPSAGKYGSIARHREGHDFSRAENASAVAGALAPEVINEYK